MSKIAYAPVGIPRSYEGLVNNGLFVGHHTSGSVPAGVNLYISADVPGVAPVFIKPYSTQHPDDYYLVLLYPFEQTSTEKVATIYVTYYDRVDEFIFPNPSGNVNGYYYDPDYKVGSQLYYFNIQELFDYINSRVPVVATENEARELVAGNPWKEDPYAYGGVTGPGVPDGTFDFESTDIPVPGLPSIGAVDTGFLTLYAPSSAEIKQLANYMWSGTFDINNLRKLFANPMESILGLQIIPTITGHPTTISGEIAVGNLGTGIYTARLTEQYYELDCGTITVPYKWGSYLDYAPYTDLSLYLPYIGMIPISPDDCIDGSIRVVYHVDMLSGTCIAFVYCNSNHGSAGHVLYTFSGNCSCPCPITEGQYENAITASLGVLSGVLSAKAGGIAGIVGGITTAANSVMNAIKPSVMRSGQFGGSSGLMGIQYPYLVLTVPHLALADEQYKLTGYPSFVTKSLANISGYNEVEVIHLENIDATQREVNEINNLLRTGVIF